MGEGRVSDGRVLFSLQRLWMMLGLLVLGGLEFFAFPGFGVS